MPLVFVYFGESDDPSVRRALSIWKDYAVLADSDPEKIIEKQALDEELAEKEVSDAVRAVDAELLSLMKSGLSTGRVR